VDGVYQEECFAVSAGGLHRIDAEHSPRASLASEILLETFDLDHGSGRDPLGVGFASEI
jgi:hypothetical protein